MRDFFINALEKLIAVVVVLMLLAVVLGSLATMFGGGAPGMPMGGFFGGLVILVVGLIYVVFLGGFMYLGLGIYQNTKAMAESMKRMEAGKS